MLLATLVSIYAGGIRGRAGVEVGARTRPDWGIMHCGPPSHFHLLTPPAHCFSIDNLIYFSNSFRTRGGTTCKPGVASTPLFISQQRALEHRPSAAVKTAQTAHALGRGLHPYYCCTRSGQMPVNGQMANSATSSSSIP